ncbi:PaaI family thioesterase [Pullulanibacillus sp. KACC 23026]|uniref:hotdog fold thioesterase n=1 Tax=Pullulanibacillus sp. KACC 23026 TaxID=3028315 RepID=UPI0023B0BCFE|nr:PaaI family thioesterase [Pullulanibacillus sp. KACC 23026]WEG14987.1 PaaI family thioesterase [Pullulanibacillus sp. KACC 23026]
MDQDTFLNFLAKLSKNTLLETLNMTYTEIASDRLVITMPVNSTVHQPMGLLHGGASVALAETTASMATMLNINPETHNCVGLEINANHLKSKRDGLLTATATPLHRGRKTMVWEIKLTDEDNRLICISRCTMAVIERQ